jgi:putative MATE family efflux protein
LLTTSGNLNKQIIQLAWPVFFQNLGRSLAIAILDSFWLGKLGSEYLAALTVGTFLSWGAYALGELVPIGTNALVSQAVGAKQTDSAKHIATLNLFNAVFTGILIAVILLPLLPVLYSFTLLDAGKSALADQFLMPVLLLLPCVILFETGSSVFRGHGNTQTPFRLLLLVFGLKAVLSPVLIFTAKLGMSGASLATMVSYGSVFILELFLLKKGSYITSLRNKLNSIIRETRYNWKVTRETLRIGMPLSFEGLAFSFIYVFVSRYVADFGTVGLAALGIGHRSEAIPYQVGEAFAVTASIIVGQNIGAANPRGKGCMACAFYIVDADGYLFGCFIFLSCRDSGNIHNGYGSHRDGKSL